MTSKEPDAMETRIKQLVDQLTNSPGKPELVAVIPTGGMGSQLSPLTLGMPKALVPINAKPMLIHILESLGHPPSVFKSAIVVGDAYLEMTEEYVKPYVPSLPVEPRFEKIPGTVPQILRRLNDKGLLTDPFLLWYSDILLPKDQDWAGPLAAYRAHASSSGHLGVLIVSLQYRYPIGIVTVEPGTDMARGFQEKPETLVGEWYRGNCAVALLSPRFVNTVKGKSLFANIRGGAFSVYPYQMPYSLDWVHVQQFADWHSIQCACHSPLNALDGDQVAIRERLKRMKIL